MRRRVKVAFKMMKAVLAGLLSAAAVIPAAAMAQDVSLREAFRQRMEARGARAGGGDRAPAVQARADAQVGGGWQRPERAQRFERAERPERAERADRPESVERRDRDERRAQAPAGGWQRQDAPRPDPRTSADPRDGRPLWTERNFRGRPDRDQARRDRDDHERNWNRDRDARNRWSNGGGWNDNRWNGGGWSSGGGWNGGRDDRRDWSWNDRGDRRPAWNRDWRRDSRYDWNRYRTANRAAYRLPRYYAPYGWNQGYRRFSIGVTLSSLLFAQDYWLDDPYSFRLPEPYGPYRWVRYYDDALLVDVYTGQVVDAEYGFFF